MSDRKSNKADEAARLARLYFTPAAAGEPHFNCAESTLMATTQALGIRSEAVPRIATAFGGGMARQGEACGAITGSLMCFGLARGRNDKSEPREPSNDPSLALMDRFRARFGALTCRELTGCDITNPEAYAAFVAAGGSRRCAEYLDLAARLVVEMIGE